MSSDHDSEPRKKKYKSWLENDTVSVPLRTIQRWQSNAGYAHISIANHDNFNGRKPTASGSFINFQESSDIENLDFDDVTVSSILTSEDGSEVFDVESNHASDNTSSSDRLDSESDSNDMNHRQDDSDNDHEPRCQNSRLDLLLYKNSRMTIDESILTLLELYVEHKWTKASLKGALEMLHKMLPDDNNLPKSVFKLFQYVENLAPSFNVIKHFYCKKCLNYCSADTKIYECFSCNANDKSISCFFEIDICKQIKYLFEKRNLAEKLKPLSSRPDNGQINDITDGSEYVRVNSREDRQKYDLTLVLNTDGLSLVKSAKSHCWPLMFIISELPEHLRESFLITIGLWYDDSCKPLMNTFLKPFCEKLERCFQEGISWVHPQTRETFVTRVVAPLIIADAPARAQLQNILNFNGRYGCNICEIKMKRAKNINGKRNCRIYPFHEQDKKLRTGQRMQAQAQKLLRTGDVHVKGVKGHSVISNLPLLDLGTCLLPEHMHSALLGVGRQIVQLCTQKYNEPWSLKKYIKDIDRFLLNIRPPHFFNRMPRPITDCGKYIMFRNQLFYY